MKRILSILFFVIPIYAFSQSRYPTLEKHLNQYEVNFKELMASRGINYLEGEVTYDKVVTAINQYAFDYEIDAVNDFAFLFYHHQSDTLHAWLFDPKGLAAEAHPRITIDSLLNLESTLKFSMSIDKMLGTTDRAKKDFKATKKYRLKTPESIDLLSGIIFPKTITNELSGKKYLLILPAVNLSSIPFSMLKPWSTKGGTLLDSMSFAFAHNFQQFFQASEAPDRSPEIANSLLAGNPSFSDRCTDGLQQLPGAEQEIRNVAQMLGVKSFIGKEATKDTLVKLMTKSSLIYLATHGWSDTEDPLRKSFLALYGKNDCGYLTPFEIQSLKLQNKPVVVLSACQSGLGKVMEAGIVGVARGFLKAGARSVTMSLWNVDDAETAELMTEFVKQMQKRTPFFPAEPWRQAVLEYRKRKKKDEPLNWAAFQTFGVPNRPAAKVSLR